MDCAMRRNDGFSAPSLATFPPARSSARDDVRSASSPYSDALNEYESDDEVHDNAHLLDAAVRGPPPPPPTSCCGVVLPFSLSKRACVLAAVLLCVLLQIAFSPFARRDNSLAGQAAAQSALPFESRRYPLAQHAPLPRLKENLQRDRQYVIAANDGGFSNQLLGFMRLVYIAHRLDRSAIVADMPPVHGEGSTARLSDFFDVPKWIEATNVSIVEFSDAKSKTAALPEDISCWGPAWNRQPFLADYKTTMHSWPFPPNLADGRKTSFQAIEVLAASDHAAWLDSHAQAEYGGLDTAPPRPEAQLLCFQNVYYVQELVFKAGRPLRPAYTIEELPPDRPLWSLIGRHLRFTRQVDNVVDEFLRTMYGGRIGKFIGVHVRQGDFIRGAKAVNGSQELVDVYAGGVREVQAALKARGVIWRDAPVVFATDSQDEQFLKLLAKMGWIYLDHGKFNTLEKYGGWYPGLLDSAVLSRGIGFVGTHKSTFSYMAQRRVETWNNGIGMVVDAKPRV